MTLGDELRAKRQRDGLERASFFCCPECNEVTEAYDPLDKCPSCSWEGELTPASSAQNAEKIIQTMKTPGYNKILGRVTQPALREADEREDDFSLETVKSQLAAQESKKGDWGAAKWLIRKYRILTDQHSGIMHVYDDEKGIYTQTGEAILKARLAEGFGRYARTTNIREILNHTRNLTLKEPAAWQDHTPKHILPLQNGLLNIDTLTLEPHTPDYWYTYKLPITYDPSAECPHIMQFLREIVEEKDIPRILDLIAMSIYCGHTLEKFWVLVGQGSNGKSVFIGLIAQFIGRENCSTLTLEQLSEDRFAAANTYGKLLNFGADIGSQAIKNTSFLKTYSGGDRVTVQFKHQQPFDMDPTATLVFSANTPPAFYDDSEGMFRRPEVITFPFKFGNEKDIAENPNMRRADPRILEKIASPAEFSGLLNLALKHLQHILKEGQLTVPHSTTELRKTYLRMSNSVAAFVTERCEPTDYMAADKGPQGEFYPAEGCLTAEEFYQAYAAWCGENGLRAEPEAWVSRRLKALQGWYLELGQKDHFGSWGNRKRTVRGIRILTQQSQQTQQTQHFLTAGKPGEISVQWENAGSGVPENQESSTVDPANPASSENAGSEAIKTSADLIAWFKNHPAEDISTDDLVGRCPAPNAERFVSTILAAMATRGDIFQVKPGRWRAL